MQRSPNSGTLVPAESAILWVVIRSINSSSCGERVFAPPTLPVHVHRAVSPCRPRACSSAAIVDVDNPEEAVPEESGELRRCGVASSVLKSSQLLAPATSRGRSPAIATSRGRSPAIVRELSAKTSAHVVILVSGAPLHAMFPPFGQDVAIDPRREMCVFAPHAHASKFNSTASAAVYRLLASKED